MTVGHDLNDPSAGKLMSGEETERHHRSLMEKWAKEQVKEWRAQGLIPLMPRKSLLDLCQPSEN